MLAASYILKWRTILCFGSRQQRARGLLFASIFTAALFAGWLALRGADNAPAPISISGKQVAFDDPDGNRTDNQQLNPSSHAVSEEARASKKLVAVPTRVVAPNITPNWAHVSSPMERIRDYRDEIDPKRKTAAPYKNVIVLSAGKFKIRYGKRFVTIKLNNVDALPFRERCHLKSGKTWFCGGTARVEIARKLKHRTLFCNVEIVGEISLDTAYSAQCWLVNTDVADIVISEGWGTVINRENKRQSNLEAEAKRLQKGLWKE